MILTHVFPAALRAGDYLADSDLWKGYEVVDVRRDGGDVVLGLADPLEPEMFHMHLRRLRADRPVLRIDSNFEDFLTMSRYMIAVIDGEVAAPVSACD